MTLFCAAIPGKHFYPLWERYKSSIASRGKGTLKMGCRPGVWAGKKIYHL